MFLVIFNLLKTIITIQIFYRYKVVYKILRHLLFFSCLRKTSFNIDIQIVSLIALKTHYKPVKKKRTVNYSSFYDRNPFSLVEKILRHFSISLICFRKHLDKYSFIHKKCPSFAFKHFCIRSGIDSTNFMHKS